MRLSCGSSKEDPGSGQGKARKCDPSDNVVHALRRVNYPDVGLGHGDVHEIVTLYFPMMQGENVKGGRGP